jgi:hypothetical protein
MDQPGILAFAAGFPEIDELTWGTGKKRPETGPEAPVREVNRRKERLKRRVRGQP